MYLRIDFRCLGLLMAEHLSDLCQRRTAAKHPCRQRVAQQMSTLVPGMQPSARQCSPNNAVNTAGAGDAFLRRFALNEDLPTHTRRTSLVKIISDGLTDIAEKWQSVHADTLAVNT
jgi:hypothetical protein